MSNSLKLLILAAGTIVTCMVIGVVFYIARSGKETTMSAAKNITNLTNELGESDKTMYDNVDISGAEVLNVIAKFKTEEMSIVVTNKAGNTTYYNYSVSGTTGKYELGGTASSNVLDAKKVTDPSYINPTKQFSGVILRNSNDAIVGLHFTQK